MKIHTEIDPETGEKVDVYDFEYPSVPDQISGNRFGWSKSNPKYRWVFRILLLITLTSILVEIIQLAFRF